MPDLEKVIKGLHDLRRYLEDKEWSDKTAGLYWDTVVNAEKLLKEQEAKQYNSHDVACILADLFGDPCACNFNDIDTWLPYKCDFRETCCPYPVGVACWEQYLKHKEGWRSGKHEISRI